MASRTADARPKVGCVGWVGLVIVTAMVLGKCTDNGGGSYADQECAQLWANMLWLDGQAESIINCSQGAGAACEDLNPHRMKAAMDQVRVQSQDTRLLQQCRDRGYRLDIEANRLAQKMERAGHHLFVVETFKEKRK